jgi:RNA polymerase-binding transcription factor DksA
MALNRRQIVQLARALGERRDALLAEIRSEVARAREEHFGAVAGATPDSGDQALADLIADLDQAEVTRDLGELRAIQAAERRFADGRYGICADCGADIPFARLEAEPSALRCIGCQQRHEKTYRT